MDCNFQSKNDADNIYENIDEVKTELGKHVPEKQDTKVEENKESIGDQDDKSPDLEIIEQQDKSSNLNKSKLHKSCAIFSLIFSVMVLTGIVYIVYTINQPTSCRDGYYGFPNCLGMMNQS